MKFGKEENRAPQRKIEARRQLPKKRNTRVSLAGEKAGAKGAWQRRKEPWLELEQQPSRHH